MLPLDIFKWAMLIATLLSTVAGVLEAINPKYAGIAAAISAAIFAFVNKIGHKEETPSVVPEVE